MARTARSLRRTQAEMRALAGSMSSGSLGGPEAVDAILAGPENPPENSEGFPLEQRMVRVVWPHEGGEVELAGSFDGWEGKVRDNPISRGGCFVGPFSAVLVMLSASATSRLHDRMHVSTACDSCG